jgi:hypothetical protein
LADLWTRDWLKQQGYNDRDIGYGNGAVTLKGQSFISPTSVSQEGKSYAPLGALQSALNKYKTNENLSDYNTQIGSLLSGLQNNNYSYDAYDAARSPEYRAAQRLGEKQAKRDVATTAEQLNSYGIANSSSMGNQASRINEAAGDKLALMIPGIIQNRQTQANAERSDQMGLLSALSGLYNTAQNQANYADTTEYGRGRDTATDQRQAALDALAQTKWEADPQSDPRYKELYLTKLQRDANAPYSSGGGGSGGGTLTERTNSNLADAYEAVDAEIAKGTSREAIENNIRNQASALVRAGIDPEKVIAYLGNRYPSTPTPEEQAQAQADEETYRLNSRPGWQQTIDYWLPWGQYR